MPTLQTADLEVVEITTNLIWIFKILNFELNHIIDIMTCY